MRLNAEERAQLEREAAGTPLGSYIKAKVLNGPPIRMRRSGLPVQDREALAKALALLGQSHLSSNLNQLAHAANIGTLPMTPDTEAFLRESLSAVMELRALLLTALGMTGGRA